MQQALQVALPCSMRPEQEFNMFTYTMALHVKRFPGGTCSSAATAACCAQALGAAREAARKLETAGVPWQRPDDYYAEMVKSDAHMARVKAQLMHAQAQIAGAEERCARAAFPSCCPRMLPHDGHSACTKTCPAGHRFVVVAGFCMSLVCACMGAWE